MEGRTSSEVLTIFLMHDTAAITTSEPTQGHFSIAVTTT